MQTKTMRCKKRKERNERKRKGGKGKKKNKEEKKNKGKGREKNNNAKITTRRRAAGSNVLVFRAICTYSSATRGIMHFRSCSHDSVDFKGKHRRVASGNQPGDSCSLLTINEL